MEFSTHYYEITLLLDVGGECRVLYFQYVEVLRDLIEAWISSRDRVFFHVTWLSDR